LLEVKIPSILENYHILYSFKLFLQSSFSRPICSSTTPLMVHLKVLLRFWMIHPLRSTGRKSQLQATGNVDIWASSWLSDSMAVIRSFNITYVFIVYAISRYCAKKAGCGEFFQTPLYICYLMAWTWAIFTTSEIFVSPCLLTLSQIITWRHVSVFTNVHCVLCFRECVAPLNLCYAWSMSSALLYIWCTAPLIFFFCAIVFAMAI
jgi:hypothetical protein